MRRNDLFCLKHMRDAARQALVFAEGRTREDLESDQMLVFSIVKAVEIVGEAAFHISDATREANPAIPWADIVAMRHRLVHAYFDINLDVLWMTVQQDIPSLVEELERILPAE